MSEASQREVRLGLEPSLARLWRYAVVLSSSRDAADDLVKATCVRAMERADQFAPGTRLDRWLFAILRSIWFNQIRARRIQEGGGFVEAEQALTFDREHDSEVNILTGQVFSVLGRLPEAQRETALMVYAEGYTYAEAAEALSVPIGTVMSRLATVRATVARLKNDLGSNDRRRVAHYADR
jgi:RNA polymerase sigma-70 factor (ECF subfamily)